MYKIQSFLYYLTLIFDTDIEAAEFTAAVNGTRQEPYFNPMLQINPFNPKRVDIPMDLQIKNNGQTWTILDKYLEEKYKNKP